MSLTTVFKQWLQSPRDMARTLMFHGICGDESALAELDEGGEIWLRVDLKKLGPLISGIAGDKALIARGSQKHAPALLQKQVELSLLIEQVWQPSIMGWIDVKLSKVDFELLAREEAAPEWEVVGDYLEAGFTPGTDDDFTTGEHDDFTTGEHDQ